MKVLLIRPPYSPTKVGLAGNRTKGKISDMFLPIGVPLGLLYIGAMLLEKKVDVEIYDALYDVDLDFLERNEEIDFLNFTFGSSRDIVAKRIKEVSPDIIGISNQYTEFLDSTIEVANIAREVCRDATIIVGGAHATTFPEDFLKNTDAVDIVVIGEGEYTIAEIIDYKRGEKALSEIKGIAFKNDSTICINKPRDFITNLDVLPLPAYELIDMERYFQIELRGPKSRDRFRYPGSERAVSMITSRGCPYNCVFCTIALHMGKKCRCHSADYLIRHIKFLKENYHINHIHFEDDNISFYKSNFESILDGLIESDLNITWDVPNGIHVNHLDEALLSKCKRSGCVYLIVGVESGDQEVSDKVVKKSIRLDKVEKVANIAKRIGIDMRAFYLIGFPGERKSNIVQTENFALRLFRRFNVFPNLSIVEPRRGTELNMFCKERGFLRQSKNPSRFGMDMIETQDFSEASLERELVRFNEKKRSMQFQKYMFFCMQHPLFITRTLFNYKKLCKENGTCNHSIDIKTFLKDILKYRNFSISKHVGAYLEKEGGKE